MEVAPTKNKDKKSSSKKSTKEADAVLPSIGLGLMSQTGLSKLTKVERLHVKKFTTGSLALGFVLQIHKNHIIVSLPGGFTGVVQLEEFSDHLHNLLADRKSTTVSLHIIHIALFNLKIIYDDVFRIRFLR